MSHTFLKTLMPTVLTTNNIMYTIYIIITVHVLRTWLYCQATSPTELLKKALYISRMSAADLECLHKVTQKINPGM